MESKQSTTKDQQSTASPRTSLESQENVETQAQSTSSRNSVNNVITQGPAPVSEPSSPTSPVPLLPLLEITPQQQASLNLQQSQYIAALQQQQALLQRRKQQPQLNDQRIQQQLSQFPFHGYRLFSPFQPSYSGISQATAPSIPIIPAPSTVLHIRQPQVSSPSQQQTVTNTPPPQTSSASADTKGSRVRPPSGEVQSEKPPKKPRGSYRCSKCLQLKRGHKCTAPSQPRTPKESTPRHQKEPHVVQNTTGTPTTPLAPNPKNCQLTTVPPPPPTSAPQMCHLTPEGNVYMPGLSARQTCSPYNNYRQNTPNHAFGPTNDPHSPVTAPMHYLVAAATGLSPTYAAMQEPIPLRAQPRQPRGAQMSPETSPGSVDSSSASPSPGNQASPASVLGPNCVTSAVATEGPHREEGTTTSEAPGSQLEQEAEQSPTKQQQVTICNKQPTTCQPHAQP